MAGRGVQRVGATAGDGVSPRAGWPDQVLAVAAACVQVVCLALLGGALVAMLADVPLATINALLEFAIWSGLGFLAVLAAALFRAGFPGVLVTPANPPADFLRLPPAPRCPPGFPNWTENSKHPSNSKTVDRAYSPGNSKTVDRAYSPGNSKTEPPSDPGVPEATRPAENPHRHGAGRAGRLSSD